MSDDVKVRIATPDDLEGIMVLARMVHSENGMHDLNELKVVQALYPALLREGGIVGVIGPVGGPLEAVTFLRVSTYWYSDTKMLEEIVVFTHPDFRAAKGKRARKLMEFAKSCSDMLGLPLTIGVLSNSRTESKVRLYERVFGPASGAFFLHNIRTGEHPSDLH